jgi:hypothetical protein
VERRSVRRVKRWTGGDRSAKELVVLTIVVRHGAYKTSGMKRKRDCAPACTTLVRPPPSNFCDLRARGHHSG